MCTYIQERTLIRTRQIHHQGGANLSALAWGTEHAYLGTVSGHILAASTVDEGSTSDPVSGPEPGVAVVALAFARKVLLAGFAQGRVCTFRCEGGLVYPAADLGVVGSNVSRVAFVADEPTRAAVVGDGYVAVLGSREEGAELEVLERWYHHWGRVVGVVPVIGGGTSHVCSFGEDGAALVWDTEAPTQPLRRRYFTATFTCVAANGGLVAAGSASGVIRVVAATPDEL